MTSGINTREMILEILLQINEEGEHSHIALLRISLIGGFILSTVIFEKESII